MSAFEHETGHRARGCLGLLLNLFLDEVRANATEEEELAFYRETGLRMAKRYPISGHGDAAVLERDLNLIFEETGFGSAQVSVADDALHIRHMMPPLSDLGGDQPWRFVFSALLEGAYDAWLRSLGSGPRLHTTISSAHDDVIEFRHGL
jgi:hypothetical protein